MPWRWVVSLVCLALVAACAPTAEPSFVGSSPKVEVTAVVAEALPQTVDPAELVLVRTAASPIIYHYPTGRPLMALPEGKLTADGARYFSAQPQEDTTRITTYEPLTGKVESSFSVAGNWQLGAVAPDGQHIVLTQSATPGQFTFQVLDTTNGRATHTDTLLGNFDVEAIDKDSRFLFLIQHTAESYVVRLYDLRAASLAEGILRDKRFLDEVMTGYAWGVVAAPDGDWLLTLYLDTRKQNAFIHALNLDTLVTLCLALESGAGEMAQLQHYTLALGPDGRTIYAANAALGVVQKISLLSYETVSTTHFEPVAAEAAAAMQASALTHDGSAFYFALGHNLWRYDTKTAAVEGPLVAHENIIGLAFSDDGSQLFVAQPNVALLTLPTTQPFRAN